MICLLFYGLLYYVNFGNHMFLILILRLKLFTGNDKWVLQLKLRTIDGDKKFIKDFFPIKIKISFT